MTETLSTKESARAWQIGWSDGYTAAEDSGTAEAPVDGWDGWTINAMGFEEFFMLLGDPQPEGEDASRSVWTDQRRQLARAYSQGAQAGADDCLRGIQR